MPLPVPIDPPPACLCVYADADALARDAARRVANAANSAIQARSRCTIALAGGSTPEKTYALLVGPEFARKIDWSRVWIFFGDERFVPRADPRSNYALAYRTLLAHVPIPPAQIFAVDTSLPSPDAAARAYDAALRSAFAGACDSDGVPVFDMILLGLGDDGHTASLFPHAAALGRADVLAVGTPPGVLPPPVDRVTLTFKVLNAAREVVFLIAGANKADALGDIRMLGALVADRPAAGVAPTHGTLTFLVDEAAAGNLQKDGT